MDRSTISTFNSAKKFAEEILHPLMKTHDDAKIKSRLGAISLEEANKLSPKMRVVNRYNALKERIVMLQTLLTEVEPTVKLNARDGEMELIQSLYEELMIAEDAYENRTEDFIDLGNEKLGIPPKLTPLFSEMNRFLDRIYIPLQAIMTKNKLLFRGDEGEFYDEDDLMERIKHENRLS